MFSVSCPNVFLGHANVVAMPMMPLTRIPVQEAMRTLPGPHAVVNVANATRILFYTNSHMSYNPYLCFVRVEYNSFYVVYVWEICPDTAGLQRELSG